MKYIETLAKLPKKLAKKLTKSFHKLKIFLNYIFVYFFELLHDELCASFLLAPSPSLGRRSNRHLHFHSLWIYIQIFIFRLGSRRQHTAEWLGFLNDNFLIHLFEALNIVVHSLFSNLHQSLEITLYFIHTLL